MAKLAVFILSVLLFVSQCTAQAPGAVPPLPWCAKDSECSDGCSCKTVDFQNLSFCSDTAVLGSGLSTCPMCKTAADCAGELGGLCIIEPIGGDSGFCVACALQKALISALTCTSTSGTPPPAPATAAPTAAPTSAPTPTAEVDPEPTAEPVCVETAWIERQGLGDGIWEKYGDSRVLCVDENLPCGTPGHLLRACNAQGCSLKTYSEMCANKPDCIETVKPVARLRHNFDWSVVRSSGCSEFGEIELTSVSQSVDAGLYSVPRFVAKTADFFNTNGLGFLCDGVVGFGGMLKHAKAFVSADSN